MELLFNVLGESEVAKHGSDVDHFLLFALLD